MINLMKYTKTKAVLNQLVADLSQMSMSDIFFGFEL